MKFFNTCFRAGLLAITLFASHQAHSLVSMFSPTDWLTDAGSISFYGEALYWKINQDQISYTAELKNGISDIVDDFNKNNDVFNLNKDITMHNQKFNWAPGWRLGVGYEFPCSGWDMALTWSSLKNKTKSKVSDTSYVFFPITMPQQFMLDFFNTSNPPNFTLAKSAKSTWRFVYYNLDYEIGYTFRVCSDVVTHPFLAVKVGSINQKQQIKYKDITYKGQTLDVKNSKTNHFYGVGPSAGVDLDWELLPCINLSGGVSGALLWGRINVKEHPTITQGTLNYFKVDFHDHKKNSMRPMMDAYLGFDMNILFCDAFRLEFGVVYEMQYWWNQWQAASTVDSALFMGNPSPQGDLFMQGLTATVGFAF